MHEQDQNAKYDKGEHERGEQRWGKPNAEIDTECCQSKSQEHVKHGIEVLLYRFLFRIPIEFWPEDIKKDSNLIDNQGGHQDQDEGQGQGHRTNL